MLKIRNNRGDRLIDFVLFITFLDTFTISLRYTGLK